MYFYNLVKRDCGSLIACSSTCPNRETGGAIEAGIICLQHKNLSPIEKDSCPR